MTLKTIGNVGEAVYAATAGACVRRERSPPLAELRSADIAGTDRIGHPHMIFDCHAPALD